MTKQEKIQEAYGEYWEAAKLQLNDDYSSDFLGSPKDWGFNFKIIFTGISIFRAIPFELIGIENNNGWIKIESEDDLPKEKELFRFIPCNKFENEFIGWIDFEKQEVFFIDFKYYKVLKDGNRYSSETNAWLTNQITHYQPIEKPKHPIY